MDSENKAYLWTILSTIYKTDVRFGGFQYIEG